MVEVRDSGHVLMRVGIYVVGVALAVAGALGLAEAIELAQILAAAAFVAGLVLVVFVHERLGGPA